MIGGLQFECDNDVYQTLLITVMYGSMIVIWKDKKKSRIRDIQMNNLRGFLCIKRIDEVSNAQIRELCRVTKGVDNRINGVFQWFGHVGRIENDRIAKRVYVGMCWKLLSG